MNTNITVTAISTRKRNLGDKPATSSTTPTHNIIDIAKRIGRSDAVFKKRLDTLNPTMSPKNTATPDGRAERTKVYDILQQNDYRSALAQLYCAYSVDVGEDAHWLNIINALEYLDADHKELFLQYSSKLRPEGNDADAYCKRFLAYFVYRHCTEAVDEQDFAAPRYRKQWHC